MMKNNAKSEILAIGHKVITDEARALECLADILDESFGDFVNVIYSASGKVAVTGIGKSGHIARKIAATLSSTGTPAYFIHPAEASHGDMGMLSTNDILIAISNSGNSSELNDILHFCAGEGINICAITAEKDSELASMANCHVILPQTPDEGPMDFVPTSSATMCLALGDALALCLMKMRGVTHAEFNKFHPGGVLGKKLSTARNVMKTGDAMPLLGQEANAPDILLEMSGKGFGCVGIIDNENKLVGIITDGDLRRHLNDNFMSMQAKDIMTLNPITIEESCLAARALYIMKEKKITNLFIVDKGKPKGIINIHLLLASNIE